LGVTSLGPARLFPELPPVAESGLPGFQSVVIFGLYVPAGTPPVIINRLNQAVAQILGKPDVREKFQNVGAETVGGRPSELADTIKSEMARLGPVIRNAGIRED
jgi:tripartite-type tricarboxylate transporter receptor subunit TctC